MALFYIYLFYNRQFLHVCNLEENLLFFTLILGSVFSDYVVFYRDFKVSLTFHMEHITKIVLGWRRNESWKLYWTRSVIDLALSVVDLLNYDTIYAYDTTKYYTVYLLEPKIWRVNLPSVIYRSKQKLKQVVTEFWQKAASHVVRED